MKTMPTSKYNSYPTVDIQDRVWPSKVIDKAPTWCSVDLRDGNQALQDPMNLEEKTAMFKLLVELGFKEIEVGFPSASAVEFDFLRSLVDQNLIPDDVTIQVLTQAREALIEKTFEALKGIKKAIVHVYNSTSILQRKVVFQKNKAGILDIAVKGVELVKKYAEKIEGTHITLEYSPESFTGTELEYALEVCEKVMDVWQPTPDHKAIINLPATVEMSTPNIYADAVEWFLRKFSRRDSILLSLHNHNDRGTAVAASELALMAGADRVEGTLFGNGERTGNVDIVTLALNMFTQGVDPELDFSNLPKIMEIYQKTTKMEIPLRQPYAGDLVYTAFSGSHQDAINKGMSRHKQESLDKWEIPYLPIDPQDVGRSYEAIVRINSQSGKGGAAYIMDNDFGFTLPKVMHPEFGLLVQRLSDKAGVEILPDQIWDCFQRQYIQATSPYRYASCQMRTQTPKENETAETESHVMAEVYFGDKNYAIDGMGNGHIDAYCNGLKKAFNINFKIAHYYEHALKCSSAAEAASYIQIETQSGFKIFGVGIDTNIDIASFKAVMSALNRANAEGKL